MGLAAMLGVLFAGASILLVCVIIGLARVLRAVASATPGRAHKAASGVSLLFAATLLWFVPRLARAFAESRTGWVDKDHNDILDPFINGGYDWSDINAGWWALTASVLGIAVFGCLLLALSLIGRGEADSQSMEQDAPATNGA